MKATIYTKGDRSVGINPIEMTVEWNGFNFKANNGPEERESWRKDFRLAFEDILQEKVLVYFDDECHDCGALKMDGKCSNKHCYVNLPDQTDGYGGDRDDEDENGENKIYEEWEKGYVQDR